MKPEVQCVYANRPRSVVRSFNMAEGGDFQFDEDEVEDDIPLEKRKKIFLKELRCMMYGFGDDRNPYTESVELLDDLVIEYITEMTKKAMEVGRPGRISVEDIIFLIRKDPKKYSRVKELLMMNEELRKARKAFDEIKYAATK
ncbi:transcription initiation factor TFIID subunit 13-like [Ostrea edulis]|uniref:transcription initiation factor TFIID subunit 13-like n=1 Tax=Ostrea edulis TaxID=37623 RepID=UPI00209518A8|nr:transcription initiation factor TFIID subunit 13-like [Ostrea edulis]